MNFNCPVCHYPLLEEPPANFTICPACGTEFEYDDFVVDKAEQKKKWDELRGRWLAAGAPWFDPDTARPRDWDPYTASLTKNSLTVQQAIQPRRLHIVRDAIKVTLSSGGLVQTNA